MKENYLLIKEIKEIQQNYSGVKEYAIFIFYNF